MAFIPLVEGVKVEVLWNTGAGEAMCVFYVVSTLAGSPDPSDLTNVLDDFDAWRTIVRPLQANTCLCTGIRATVWDAPDGLQQFTVPGTPVAGSAVAPAMPNNVAICTTHYTGRIGRSRRGRTYLPGIAEDAVGVGDIVLAARRTTLNGSFATLRGLLFGHNFIHVVASFVGDGVPRAVGLGTPITVSVTDQYSDSQRRRLAGRGT